MGERELFNQILERSTEERQSFLEDVCRDDPELQLRMECLLRMHSEVGGLLDQLDALQPENLRSCWNFLEPPRLGGLGRLGDYEILSVIGAGGGGTVFRAYDAKLDRTVAIKVPRSNGESADAILSQLLAEARAAAAIPHDNVVEIYAVELAGETPFLVMEYIEGESLQELIDESGPLEISAVVEIAIQLCLALQPIHAAKKLHGDLKPSNLLRQRSTGRIKITDFGMSRPIRRAGPDFAHSEMGTPRYMAPERLTGQGMTLASELYEFGAVLYALCTGQTLDLGGRATGILPQIRDEMPCRIQGMNPKVPQWLADLIQRLTAKSPDERPQSLDEVRQQLLQNRGAFEKSRVRSGTRVGIGVLAILGIALLFGLLDRCRSAFDHSQNAVMSLERPARVGDPPVFPVQAPFEIVRADRTPAFQVGSWIVEDGGVIRLGDADDGLHLLVFGDLSWADYDLDLEVTQGNPEVSECSVLVHVDESATNYWKLDVGAFEGSQNVDLVPVIEGIDPWLDASRQFVANALKGTPEHWYRIHMEVRGEIIRVSVDGQRLLESQRVGLSRGRIGLRTNRCSSARWRNCTLRTFSGLEPWTGWPTPQVASPRSVTSSGFPRNPLLGAEYTAYVGSPPAELVFRWLPPRGGGGGFWMSDAEITQRVWTSVGVRIPTGSDPGNPSQSVRHDDWPVESVTSAHAEEFARRVSKLLGVHVELPTDKDWEFAAGSMNRQSNGFDSGHPGWHRHNSLGHTHQVRQKEPNVWKLYDMFGNCEELVRNSAGTGYLVKGGSWVSEPELLIPSASTSIGSLHQSPSTGFRVLHRIVAPIHASASREGEWETVGEEVIAKEADHARILVFGDPTWTNYDLSVEVFHDSAGDSERSILVQVSDNGTSFWKLDLMAFGSSKNLDLVPVVRGNWLWTGMGRRFLDGRLDGRFGWYSIELQVRSGSVRVLVDGVPVATTFDGRLIRGRVGLRANGAGSSRWRNCVVRAVNGEVLWKGWPDLAVP